MEPSDGLDLAMCEVFVQNIKMENVFEENHEGESDFTSQFDFDSDLRI